MIIQEKFTGALRLHDYNKRKCGLFEQQVEVLEFDSDNKIVSCNLEWREVPCVSKRKVGYINIYGDWDIKPMFFENRDEADKHSHHRIACIRVEYEEGQFDD